MPVPKQNSAIARVSAEQLDIKYWIADGQEVHALNTIRLPQKSINLWDDDHHFGPDYQYILYYTPQGSPFTPANRAIRTLTSNSVDNWYGNLMVVKADENNGVVNIKERELGLIEYIVAR